MRALNERLQKMQEEQAARQDALKDGRIRVERPEHERDSSTNERTQKAGA